MDEVVEHHPDVCRRCGTLLDGEDPAPMRHQVIEIPSITPLVIEHRLHRLVCLCCSTSTCAPMPVDVEASPYGPRLSAFPLSFSKTQALLPPFWMPQRSLTTGLHGSGEFVPLKNAQLAIDLHGDAGAGLMGQLPGPLGAAQLDGNTRPCNLVQLLPRLRESPDQPAPPGFGLPMVTRD